MYPTDGLIANWRGQMILATVCLVIGLVAWAALTIMVLVRKAPPLTTQRDEQTGVRDHGIGRWAAVFSTFTVGPPVGFMVVRTLVEGNRRLLAAVGPAGPIVLASMSLAVLGLLGWVWWTRRRRPAVPTFPQSVPYPPEPYAGETVVPQPMGWSLPPETPHWEHGR